MTILHVLDHSLPLTSGYSYRSQSILRHQYRAGLDPVVVTSPKQGSTEDGYGLIDGIPHFRTGPAGNGGPFVREARLMARLARRIGTVARARRARLIHAHSPVLNGLAALWAGARLGLPVLYEVRSFWEDAAVTHGTFAEGSLRYEVGRALESMVMRRAGRVVAICAGIRREVLGRGVPESRVSIVPNGVAPEWFEPRPAKPVPGADSDGPVFAYAGSFSYYEGLPFLVRTAPRFLGAIPGARLLLAGGGRDEPAVRDAVQSAGPGVSLLGRLPQQAMRDLYARVDVLLLPRRRTRLTELVTPLKPLEAMAMGKVVLASDVGGHRELITDGITGELFRTESADDLVERAVALGTSRERRAALGVRARIAARARTWDHVVSAYGPLYEALA